MDKHQNELPSRVVIIHKNDAYWIATAVRFKGYEDAYVIASDLDRNGFEEITDAYNYVAQLTKEIVA